MKHRATPRFWACYESLPQKVRQLANRCYKRMVENPEHPSLKLKKIGQLWSVRVGLHHRALAVESKEELLWVWIGTHAEYDQILQQRRT
jgi:hypothetical protein